MKILFLNYEYPPLGGGAGNATEYLLKEYAHISDLEVHLVTSSADGACHNFNVGEKVFVHSVPIWKNGNELHHQSIVNVLVYAWRGYCYADKLLKKTKFDAIHAFFGVPCGSMALCLSKKYAMSYIVSLRGADVPGFSERFSLLYVFLQPLIRLVWRRAKFVVANSEGLKQLAQKTNSEQKIEIIQNGVDIQMFKPAEKKQNEYVCILSVSRLTPRKGLRYLIQAIKILLENTSLTEKAKIELQIIGDGDEKNALEQLANELGISHKVKFLGRILHENLASYYAQADIFCLPSLNEGMSNTVLEALATGMPIVATKTGGTEELVRDGENGFFAAQKSAQDLAEKLESLINDETLRVRFGQASRKRAETMSWANVAEKYVKLYMKSKK
jgi:glycosyltransferase involved in cell wall biosynthesis